MLILLERWLPTLNGASDEAISVVTAAIDIMASFILCSSQLQGYNPITSLEFSETIHTRAALPLLASSALMSLLAAMKSYQPCQSAAELRYRSHPSIVQGSVDVNTYHAHHRCVAALVGSIFRWVFSLCNMHKGLISASRQLLATSDVIGYLEHYANTVPSPQNRTDMAISRRIIHHLAHYQMIEYLQLVDPDALVCDVLLQYGVGVLAQIPAGFEHIAQYLLETVVQNGMELENSSLHASVSKSFLQTLNPGPLSDFYVRSSHARWLRNAKDCSNICLPHRDDEERFVISINVKTTDNNAFMQASIAVGLGLWAHYAVLFSGYHAGSTANYKTGATGDDQHRSSCSHIYLCFGGKEGRNQFLFAVI